MSELSFTGARWVAREAPEAPEGDEQLCEVAARCLALRQPVGVSVQDWLAPSLDHLHDPFAMHGMVEAVERLQRAMRVGERVRIITDYDVDGTTSSLILQAVLRLLAPQLPIDYHIPSRFGEGYGLSLVAIDAAADAGVGLIVTADIGVRDHAAVARARVRGVDVLICDHHLPAGESVPEGALVLCPPQAACSYPNPSLAACGVSLKVAQALLADHPQRDRFVVSLLKLAAIGTVADLVPLSTLENRAIVALGLDALNRGPHSPGLAALLKACGLELGEVRVSDLGFRVGPRINAAGRVADANLVIELLTTRDSQRATALAEELEGLNRQRRDLQRRLVDDVVAGLPEHPPAFVVVAGPEDDGWHRGVVGIVASRIKDEVHRPTAVIAIQGDVAVGSVRSVRGVHAVEALGSVADLLVKFGGHPAAAGFTVLTKDLDALRERLVAWVEARVTADELVAERVFDVEVGAEDLTDRLRRELDALGPFGMGNPRPRLVVRDVQLARVELRGAEQRMVRAVLPRPGAGGVDVIWWDQAEHAEALRADTVDLLGSLEQNVFRGRATLQLKLEDARVARGR